LKYFIFFESHHINVGLLLKSLYTNEKRMIHFNIEIPN